MNLLQYKGHKKELDREDDANTICEREGLEIDPDENCWVLYTSRQCLFDGCIVTSLGEGVLI